MGCPEPVAGGGWSSAGTRSYSEHVENWGCPTSGAAALNLLPPSSKWQVISPRLHRLAGRAKYQFSSAQSPKAQLAPLYQRRCSRFPCCKDRDAMLMCWRIKFLRTTLFAVMITALVAIVLSAPINDGHKLQSSIPQLERCWGWECPLAASEWVSAHPSGVSQCQVWGRAAARAGCYNYPLILKKNSPSEQVFPRAWEVGELHFTSTPATDFSRVALG